MADDHFKWVQKWQRETLEAMDRRELYESIWALQARMRRILKVEEALMDATAMLKEARAELRDLKYGPEGGAKTVLAVKPSGFLEDTCGR